VNDSEQRIRQLLNESVDARLGPRRPAPPFAPRRVRRLGRIGPWAAPLVAAACVAAVVGATIGVAHLASSGHHPQPGRSVPPPTPTPTTAPSSPPQPGKSTAPTSNTAARKRTTSVPGLVLEPSSYGFLRPSGWSEQPLRNYGGPASFAAFTGTPVDSTLTVPAASSILYEVNGGSLGVLYDTNHQPVLAVALGEARCTVADQHAITSNTIAFACARVAGQTPSGILVVEPYPQGSKQLIVTLAAGEQVAATEILNSFRSTASNTTNSPPVAAGRWTDNHLVITAHALGAVSVGMTMTEAAHAAGFTSFTAIGDAVSIPTPWQGPARSAAGYPELYVSHWAGPSGSTQAFTCVGAFLGTSTAKQVITTPEGVRLGDPASRILAVYGSRAHYVPAPQSGMDPRAGYVISDNGYDLVFKLDPHGRQIVAIAGGLDPVTPSTCVG
jgi:hypothetical protein